MTGADATASPGVELEDSGALCDPHDAGLTRCRCPTVPTAKLLLERADASASPKAAQEVPLAGVLARALGLFFFLSSCAVFAAPLA